MGRPRKKYDMELMIRLYKEYNSVYKVANKMGNITKTGVYKRLKELKIIPNRTQNKHKQSGYWMIYVNGIKIYQHIYVWLTESEWRFIPLGFVVHHINQNRLDNRIENLVCLPFIYHNSLHHKGVAV